MTKEEYMIILEADSAGNILNDVVKMITGALGNSNGSIGYTMDELYDVLKFHCREKFKSEESADMDEFYNIYSNPDITIEEKAEILSDNIQDDFIDEYSYEKIKKAYDILPELKKVYELLIGRDIPENSDNCVYNNIKRLEILLKKYKDHIRK